MKSKSYFFAVLLLFLSFPVAASAISYLPGQTLNPSCPPTDPTCVVVPNTTSSSFIATSSNATSTFAGNVAVSGDVSIGSLSGILRAVAGVITNTLVSLTSDVTGILGISNGGTGISSAPAYGQVLVGNGSGGYTLTSTSSLGVAASSVAWGGITGTLSNQADLQSALNAKLASSSLSATYPLAFNSSTGIFSLGFGTTTTNIWSNLQTFSAGASTTNLTVSSAPSGILHTNASGNVSAGAVNLASSDVTGTLAQGSGGTGFASYTPGAVLYADGSGNLQQLAAGSNGQVLKIAAGLPGWGVDLTSGGGGGNDGIFATTSSGVVYPIITSNPVVIGTNATSTTNSIFEVSGQQYISTKLGIATTTPATTLSVGGSGYFTGGLGIGTLNTSAGTLAVSGNTTLASATSTNFAITNLSNVLLSANGSGSVGVTAFSGPLTFSGNTLTLAQANGGGNGFLASADWTTFNGKISSSSLSALYPLAFNSSTGLFSLAFGTTTANSWSNLQTFSGGASTTAFTASGEGFFATASTTNLTVSSAPSGFLRTNALGVVSATSTFSLVSNVFGILGIGFGGTGTSTAPTYGQLLVGNAGGGYTLTSTSSLGISGGGGTWGSIAGTLSNQTDLQSALNLKLSSSSLATSALLAGLVTDHTGSGSLVFATSPTFAGTPVFSGGLISNSVNSTTTIPNGSAYAWTVATSSSASPLIEVDTTGNDGTVSIGAASSSGSSVVLGATGEPANLVFAASSTIEGAGTGQAITIGANSDVVDFGVNVGIGTTTPGSIFSVSGVGNWTGATTTYYATGGINLTGGGCFAINGSCISGAGGSNYWTSSGGNIYNNTGTDVGIGTTTPGSLLSLNGIANFAAATSTFYSTGGINITHGCFSVAGTCITGGGTSYTFSYPLLNTSGTISQAWGTTTADIWSQLQTFTSGFVSNASSTFTNTLNINGGTQNYGAVSTSTIPNNVPYAWTLATSTTASPLLGITTTSGSEQVSIGVPNSNIIIGATNSSPNLIFQNNATIEGSNTLLTFGAGTDRLDFAVNTGIGTTTPYSALEVWGPNTASTSAFAVVNSASTTEFTVYDTGNAVLAGSLQQNSDIRLKTNIQALDGSTSLAEIDNLNPVTFNWIDPEKSGVPQFGFIAQQVENIFPNLVATTAPTALTPDGTLSLNYIDLISPIIAAIQELDREITTLESTVAGFAQSITTDVLSATTVNAHQLCLDGTCVTATQFQALLAAANQSASAPASPSSSPSDATDTPDSTTSPQAPVIQINGNDPAIIQVGATYTDLGATITGPQADLNLGIQTYVNGMLMNPVQIDTSTTATDTIDYVVTDSSGNTSTSTRTVIIQAIQEPAAPVPDPGTTASSTSATTTPSDPTSTTP